MSTYRYRAIFLSPVSGRVMNVRPHLALPLANFAKPPTPEGNVVSLSAHHQHELHPNSLPWIKIRGPTLCYQFTTCQLISGRWNDNSLSDLLRLHDWKPVLATLSRGASSLCEYDLLWGLFAKTTLPVCVFLGGDSVGTLQCSALFSNLRYSRAAGFVPEVVVVVVVVVAERRRFLK